MIPRFRFIFVLSIYSVFAFFGLAEARGLEGGGWCIGISPSYHYIKTDDFVSVSGGGGGQIFLEYSLNDALSGILNARWSGHSYEGAVEGAPNFREILHVLNVGMGIRYGIDISPVVPSLEVALGWIHFISNEKSEGSPELQAGMNVDYYFVSGFIVGIGFHYHAFLSDPMRYPVYVDGGPRLGYRWR